MKVRVTKVFIKINKQELRSQISFDTNMNVGAFTLNVLPTSKFDCKKTALFSVILHIRGRGG